MTWEVYVDGGRSATGLDAVAWARQVEQRGAGEILLTSMDGDGAKAGVVLEPERRTTNYGAFMSLILHTLMDTIRERQAQPRAGSYTAALFAAGEDEISQKVGEEAIEVILAAKGQGPERLISETADLLYHLLVLLASHNLTLAQVETELARRSTANRGQGSLS